MSKKKEVKTKKVVSKTSKKEEKKDVTITPLAKILFDKKISSEVLRQETGFGADVISKIKNGRNKNTYASTLKIIADALTRITGEQYKVDDLI